MKKKNETVVCKQCGKIIVGVSKAGLCESCFSKDAGIVAAGMAAAPILYKAGKKVLSAGKKHGPAVVKCVKTLIDILKK